MTKAGHFQYTVTTGNPWIHAASRSSLLNISNETVKEILLGYKFYKQSYCNEANVKLNIARMDKLIKMRFPRSNVQKIFDFREYKAQSHTSYNMCFETKEIHIAIFILLFSNKNLVLCLHVQAISPNTMACTCKMAHNYTTWLRQCLLISRVLRRILRTEKISFTIF